MEREIESEPQFLFLETRNLSDRAAFPSCGNFWRESAGWRSELCPSCFTPSFLWLLFLIKSKSKILKYTSTKAVLKGELNTHLEPGCPKICFLILRTPPSPLAPTTTVPPQRCRKVLEYIGNPRSGDSGLLSNPASRNGDYLPALSSLAVIQVIHMLTLFFF